MDLTPRLLDALGAVDPDACWAASGAMALTGHADGPPLLVPASVADVLVRVAERFAVDTGVGVDGPGLLGERAACTGWQRRGRTSVGGATRLLRAADGAWLAVALPRVSDVELVPAWLRVDERALDADDPWPAVSAAVARRPASVVADAVLLGLACAQLGETTPGPLAIARPHGVGPPVNALRDVVVADLSALWAGPLCADLLGRAGADVVKVESVQRPDGARNGDRSFYALLNTGKRSATVDLAKTAGRSALAALLANAHVVIESSRPRALEHLGIAAEDLLAHGGRTRVWCSITGHGRRGSAAHRVGFGDDAAVAGGLVSYDGDGAPVFCADAAADPASGLVAAAAIVDRLAAGGRWLVDVALARTASFLAAGTTSATPWAGEVATPRARNPRSAS